MTNLKQGELSMKRLLIVGLFLLVNNTKLLAMDAAVREHAGRLGLELGLIDYEKETLDGVVNCLYLQDCRNHNAISVIGRIMKSGYEPKGRLEAAALELFNNFKASIIPADYARATAHLKFSESLNDVYADLFARQISDELAITDEELAEVRRLMGPETVLTHLNLNNIFKAKPDSATDFQKAKAEALIRLGRTSAGGLQEPAGVAVWRAYLGR